MTSSNGNIFRVTGHLCGEFTGPRWIPRTKASDAELWCFLLICAWINGWVNNREAGDLRRHHTHYDVTVMEGNGSPITVVIIRSDITWHCIQHNSCKYSVISIEFQLRLWRPRHWKPTNVMMPTSSLWQSWHYSNSPVFLMWYPIHRDNVMKWKRFLHYLLFVWRDCIHPQWIPLTKAGYAELWRFLHC